MSTPLVNNATAKKDLERSQGQKGQKQMIPIESKLTHNSNSNNNHLVNFASKLVKEATVKDSKNSSSFNKGDSFVMVCENADRKQESNQS
jgi:hypothetical protein